VITSKKELEKEEDGRVKRPLNKELAIKPQGLSRREWFLYNGSQSVSTSLCFKSYRARKEGRK
jgi:hypothetical protein